MEKEELEVTFIDSDGSEVIYNPDQSINYHCKMQIKKLHNDIKMKVTN